MDYVGGCQCGKVRYRAEDPRGHASVCYCRMCQRASGGPFMAFVSFPDDRVHWSQPPAIFASSNAAERGFCRDCGTPLSFRYLGRPYIGLTINSLDDPEAVQPEMRLSAPSEVSWCRSLANLPTKEMDLTRSPGFVTYQHSGS